jgi:hypothetical protein
MECIFHEVFHIFLIDCEKSKKTPKKLLPQKTGVINTLSSKPRFLEENSSFVVVQIRQIDKMPENMFFGRYCSNEKKAVTLSQLI